MGVCLPLQPFRLRGQDHSKRSPSGIGLPWTVFDAELCHATVIFLATSRKTALQVPIHYAKIEPLALVHWPLLV